MKSLLKLEWIVYTRRKCNTRARKGLGDKNHIKGREGIKKERKGLLKAFYGQMNNLHAR
jgi:hypothetical protein